MKTTVDIADPLLRRAKRLAAQRRTTLKAVIEEALRKELASEAGVGREPVRTHTFGGHGLRAGLSWSDWSEIRSMSYEGRGG
jgi:hypothetical protein